MFFEQAIRENSWLSDEITSSEMISDIYLLCREVYIISLNKQYDEEYWRRRWFYREN